MNLQTKVNEIFIKPKTIGDLFEFLRKLRRCGATSEILATMPDNCEVTIIRKSKPRIIIVGCKKDEGQ